MKTERGVRKSQLRHWPATQLEDMSTNGGVVPDQSQWRRSIKKYTIECLECGATFKQLSIRHLKEHNLEMRVPIGQKYGIPRSRTIVC